MMAVFLKDGLIMTIEFDEQLYSVAAIKQAICDYREIAEIVCEPMVSSIKCIITKSSYDMELTKLEFCNYVLSLSVSMDGNQI